MLKKFLAKRAGKVIAAALGTVLAGGITSIAVLQPAVEKTADYAASAIEGYCKLPAVDRTRFRDEVNERLQKQGNPLFASVAITIVCPADVN